MSLKSYAAWLTINRSCNLRCEWCYAKSLEFRKNDMSLTVVKKAMDIFASLPMRTVFLIGGEPTLHPDFLEIVRMVSDAGLRPVLITNSILFESNDFLEKTVDSGVIGINTSLKGANAEQYKKNTGVDIFSNIVGAIRNIEMMRKKKGIYHRVSITMCKSLFENIDELVNLLKECNVNEFSIDTERPIFINNKPQPASGMTPVETAEILMSIYPTLKKSGIKFSVKISLPFCLFSSSFIEELKERGELLSGCQLIGGSGLVIDPMGGILPCNHFCENKLGSIGTDFSTGDEYLSFRNRQDIAKFYEIMSYCPDKKCQRCSYWTSCGGGCRLHWFCNDAGSLIK